VPEDERYSVVEPRKKKIDAKQFAQDIEAGMHESALMAAYGLSPNELQRAMQKLEIRGLLKHPQTVDPVPARTAPESRTFECPSCGATHREPFDECPHCGIVLSKFSGQAQRMGEQHRTDDLRSVSSGVQISSTVKERNHLVAIAGIGVVAVILVCGYLYYRAMKQAEIRSMAQNVQAVLDASNGETPPNYGYLAKNFGAATGAMAAVMESRKTPYSAQMHELYQKMVYLGELQRRMQQQRSSSAKGTAAYQNAIRRAGDYDDAVRNELEGLGETLDSRRGALDDASRGGGAAGEIEAPPVVPGSRARPTPPGAREGDDTSAQFEKAQDELRSLCAQVLNILAVQ
jgi:hypothetical protein